MQKFEINLHLNHVREAKAQAVAANREFLSRVDKVMTRLIHEAAAQRMSVSEVAHESGFKASQIKARMKDMNLNPSTGRVLLSRQAASILEHNAEILGVEPSEIDLMSPLMYLPAGPHLKDEVSSVTEFPETDLTDEERAVVIEAAEMFGPTNGDLITLVNVLLGERARKAAETAVTPA